MGWRDDRAKVIRSQPPEPAQHVQVTDDSHQKNIKELDSPFDLSRWTGEIDTLMVEIRQHDPRGGCWEWVERNLVDKWRQLKAAMNEIDTAFQEQCAGKLHQAIACTRRLYHECISAWKKVLPECGENPNKTQ